MAEPINVLHLSTHDEECGIAIFQQNIVNAMGDKQVIHNVFFDISPNKLKLLTGDALTTALGTLFAQLKDFDILHIQLEYSFYRGDQLQRIVDGAKAQHKKVLFTLHTPPHARREHNDLSVRKGLHPRSWVAVARINRAHKAFLRSFITPLHKADLLIVPSQASKVSFAEYGVPESHMQVIELPVPEVDTTKMSALIAEMLHKQPGDVILSTAGFIAETKGIIPAIKSLTFLPNNYKLAIIGGAHPSGQNDSFYDEACDLIVKLNLQDRVYITGYIGDDAQRDALIREADVCLYPYNKAYYNYVSSAALTNAIANERPIVAYQTYTFAEANQAVPFINFCQSPNYYEIARTVLSLDAKASIALTKEYAQKFSVKKQARLFAKCYQALL